METKEKKQMKEVISHLWEDKRLRSILITVGVVLLCAIVYIVLLFTVLKPEENKKNKPTIGNHGEQMENGKPFVVNPIENDKLLSITVENEKGGYHYYRGTDDQFYFEGAEAMFYDATAAWNQEDYSEEEMQDVLSSLPITTSLENFVSYMLADQEVVGYDKDNLAAYGLANGGRATLTVRYENEKGEEESKTVHIGSQSAYGSGYYCMLEGRDALYVLADDYNVGRCLFTDVKSFLLPQIAPAVSSATYTDVSTLSIKKHGETYVSLRALSEEEYKQNGELFTHVFETPEGYYPSPDNLQTLLQSFVNFTGETVMEFDIARRLEDPALREEMLEIFRLYSLLDRSNQWTYELSYSYPEFDCTLYVSEKLEVRSEGASEEEKEFIYYIYSPDFDCIVEFKAENLDWVEWDLLTFMDNHSFSVSIDNVASIEMKYESVNAKFTLTGKSQDLKVKSSNGVAVDVDNFRQLYKSILFTTMDGYADKPESASEILWLKITLRDGTVYEYSFYGLTARKAYYSLNGSGQFYINRDYVKQMMSACSGILEGKTVTVDRRN